jgi:hypothetical protein
VVHQIVEVHAIQACTLPPPGDLTVDVIEPEAHVKQSDTQGEASTVTGADRRGPSQACKKRETSDLVR